jgi:subtilisin family serine protease
MDCCIQPGQIIILPKKGGGKDLKDLLRSTRDEDLDIFYTMEDILERYRDITTPFNNTPNNIKAFPFVARVDEGKEIERAHSFMQYSEVEIAVPNFYTIPANNNIELNEPVIASSLNNINYHLNGFTGSGIRIAVLDTGVNKNLFVDGALHPTQYDVDKPREPNDGLSPFDKVGHGTVVASIISRIAPEAELYSVKVLEETGNLMGVIAGLYIAQQKIRPHIFNLSLGIRCDIEKCMNCGYYKRNPFLLWQVGQLFSSFQTSNNSTSPIIVAAAGNGSGELLVPARLPDVIAVGSFDYTKGDLADYSIYNKVPIDRFVLAPGGLNDDNHCIATLNEYGRRRFYGTSFSCAFVSGICAGYLDTYGNLLSRNEVLQSIALTCDKNFPNYSVKKHGLGLLKFDPAVRDNILRGFVRDAVLLQNNQIDYAYKISEIREAINKTSYFIWEKEGCPQGLEIKHWIEAKRTLGIPDQTQF